MTREGFRIGLIGKQNIFCSRFVFSPIYLALHFRRVALEKGDHVKICMQERVVQIQRHCLLVGGFRLVQTIQEGIV